MSHGRRLLSVSRAKRIANDEDDFPVDDGPGGASFLPLFVKNGAEGHSCCKVL